MPDIFDEVGDIFEQVSMSTADMAKQRLASRGLTPEAVKAGHGMTRPEDINFAPPTRNDGGFLYNLAATPARAVGAVGGAIVDHLKSPLLPTQEELDVAHGRAPLTSRHLGPILGPVQAINETFDEASRRGAANESTAGMYAQPAAAALTMGAGAIAPQVGGALVARAPKTYAKIGGKANAETWNQIAPKLVDEKVVTRNPREDLVGTAEARASAIDVDSMVSGDMPVRPMLKNVEAAQGKQFDMVPAAGQGPPARVPKSPESDAINAALEEYRGILEQHSPTGTIDAKQALGLRREWEKRPGERGYYVNPNAKITDPMRVRMDAADAIRSELNQLPDVGAANAEKSFWLKTKAAAEKAPENKAIVPQGNLATAALGQAVAGLVGGPAGHVVTGAAVADIIRRLMQSPGMRSRSAIAQSTTGKALQNADPRMFAGGAAAAFAPEEEYLLQLLRGQ